MNKNCIDATIELSKKNIKLNNIMCITVRNLIYRYLKIFN